MLSMQKLLVLALILLAVWYGFKWIGRLDAARRSSVRQDRSNASSRRVAAEDMVKCPSCAVYVSPRGASACGRPDCPYAQ